MQVSFPFQGYEAQRLFVRPATIASDAQGDQEIYARVSVRVRMPRASAYILLEKKPALPAETKPPMSNQQFETLQQKLENLSKKMAQMTKHPRNFQCPRCRTDDHTRSNCPSPYCPYCRSDSHSLASCTKRPPPGTCFDCKRPNCRRGKPGCPGQPEASS